MIIQRKKYLNKIDFEFKAHNIVCILGVKNSGKTTLANEYIKNKHADFPRKNYFDLENPKDLARLESDPLGSLEELEGLIIIDEVHLAKDLFKTLRYLCDHNKHNQRYLILGSASKELLRQTAETLAGRIGYMKITPFSIHEVGEQKKLWLNGGYPKVFLTDNEEVIENRLSNYIKNYLYTDLREFGINVQPEKMDKFWRLLAHYMEVYSTKLTLAKN